MTEDTALSRRGFLCAAAGSTAVGAVGAAAAQEDTETEGGDGTATGTDGGGTETDGGGNETDGGGDGGGGDTETDGGGGGGGEATPMEETVTVGPGGDFVFEPDSLKVTPGSTVTWEWDSDNHNIVVENQPDDANWEGHESLEDTGFTYENTFDVEGTYDYFCQPHRQQGMEASIEVTQDVSTPGGGGGGGGPPPVPDTAKTLGVATTIGMLSTLGLAYLFLKYGGAETAE